MSGESPVGANSMTGRAAVSVHGLSKVYEPTPGWMRLLVHSASNVPVTALADVDFAVEAGQICAVIGANGAGKSTLFRILTGLTTPTSGFVEVLGMDPVVDAHRIRRYVGFMPAEERTLFLRHSCRENLRFHGRMQGMSEVRLKGQIDEALELVGLWEARDRTGFALSSGMRSRLMLARALLHRPQVLILDEPTGSIDPIGAHSFLQLIIEITSDRGIATLISSHRLEEIEALRDNVVLLDRGKIVFSGDLDRIKLVADHKRYEVICASREAAIHIGRELKTLLPASIAIEVDESVVRFPTSADPAVDLGWFVQFGDQVEGVARRKRSLRETIAALLADDVNT